MKIKISPGNTKTGRIPAISLPPITSCRKDAPCKKDCYAMKSFIQYPNVRTAWNSNLEHWNNNKGQYFRDIKQWIEKKRNPVPFFRFHVSGDIVDEFYLEEMHMLAIDLPDTNFLAFTKQYEVVNGYMDYLKLCSDYSGLEENFTIVFSVWPGFPIDNRHHFPLAFMEDGTETRLTGNELTCPGNCETCGMCWQLPLIGKNVVFHKH